MTRRRLRTLAVAVACAAGVSVLGAAAAAAQEYPPGPPGAPPPPGNEPPGNNPPGNNPPGNNPPGNNPPGNNPPGNNPPGNNPPGNNPPGNTPNGTTPNGNTPNGNTPNGSGPNTGVGSVGDEQNRSESCNTFQGTDPAPSSVFAQGTFIRVECEPGTFDPNEPVDVFVRPGDIRLVSTRALADGGLRTGAIRLPTVLGPGAYTIVLRAASGEELLPIRIARVGVASAGDVAGTGGLPATGRDIALLLFWGSVLVAGGTFLIVTTRRRWQEARARTVAIRSTEGLRFIEPSEVEPIRMATWLEPDDPDEPPSDPTSDRFSGVVQRLEDEVERWDQR